jgi:CO/xanthine dehydrogenase Mo-binding subunit
MSIHAHSTDSPAAFTLSRRDLLKAGGALFVSFALPLGHLARAAAVSNVSPDPSQLASWLEIHSENSVLVRTGRTETGVGMSGYYAQVVAEELSIRPEAITLITGDTDKTPDGGYSAGFLWGMYNVRKVAAYTYQALLDVAATQLGVPVSALSVSDGVVSGGGKTVSYGKLLEGQHLELKISISGALPKMDPTRMAGLDGLDGFTVTGDPSMKSVSQYKVIGTSYPVPGIPDKVTGKAQWSCDVSRPGMLHARMVRPPTVGSTLVSVGTLDKKQFPTAEVVVKKNLVAVVSPNEWEAVGAARSLASTTKWTDWAGLGGSDNLTKTLRACNWGAPIETKGKAEETKAALAAASKQISLTYEQPYVRHAPIGPFVAVADVRSGGSVTVWTHSAQSQGLRTQIANTLGISPEKVVVRWLDHSGQYGRTTFGGDGAEADAVVLSQLTGKPVRVQWSMQDDMAWSTVSPGWVSDLHAAVDPHGRLVAIHTAQYSPHQTDARLLGAILAGMPTSVSKANNWVATEWPTTRSSVSKKPTAW